MKWFWHLSTPVLSVLQTSFQRQNVHLLQEMYAITFLYRNMFACAFIFILNIKIYNGKSLGVMFESEISTTTSAKVFILYGQLPFVEMLIILTHGT